MSNPTRLAVRVIAVLMILAAPAACTDESTEISFQPSVLPVKLTWSDGDVGVQGDLGLVTPIGKIEVNAGLPLPDTGDTSFYVIFRDKHAAIDDVYRVTSGSGSFHAVVDGTADFSVDDQRVTIEVLRGTVKTIEFKKTERLPVQKGNGVVHKWTEFWQTTFHRPFSWSRWAYDDSAMHDWPPLGFLWFLIRLVAAIVLGVLDLILFVVQIFAAIAFALAGAVAMNVVYGVAALLGLMILGGFGSLFLTS
ncbi:hypothetical protein [Microbispora bryophytorum]|uniref:Uncharacterized protein n=1 Tax=Microbispora bryophytorum subsp. camponoti TaxID=1677852 RepID=A0ABR8KZH5_9ACTN|nr:hypothetical protein [Microbispora camponoti]MBD3144112.1 hypothetical protein [Microbispora camponoti]